jgi:hypothetical protein
MAEDIQRSRGRGQGYKFDRGGTNTEFGPFIGRVKNNVDSARLGRLQVYIEQYGGSDPEDESLWRTVSYVPPFYGTVSQSGTDDGTGTYIGNPQSYGMWFTPPDINTQVICFFVEGDPDQGYYIGCVPEPGISHMIPAVGASKKFDLQNSEQKNYFSKATQLPVTEINNENEEISEAPRYYDQAKPVHSVVAGIMLQQGLINDTQRGPITSNSQRESPSRVYGISTPGRPVYQGGASEKDIKQKIKEGAKSEDFKVTGRRGGHSIVMDDGDLEGNDNLVRIRTSKGHQITMSDDGEFFFIIHANGQTWVELGSEGTIDMFSTNSVNVRSQGQINLHADKSINMFAAESINIKSKNVRITSSEKIDLAATTKLTMGSKGDLGIVSDGAITLKSTSVGGWDGGQALSFRAGKIDLNGGTGPGAVASPAEIADVELSDTKFVEGTGWEVQEKTLTTIVSRAPTHEPFPYHNKGVDVKVSLSEGSASSSTSAASTTGTTPTTATNAVANSTATGTTGTAGTTGTVGATNATPTTGNAPVPAARGLGEFQREFGTQTAQAPGQATYLAGNNISVANPPPNPTVDYNDPQFQSQSQLDAEIAAEARLSAKRDAFLASNPTIATNSIANSSPSEVPAAPPSAAAVEKLNNFPVTLPVSAAQILKQSPATSAIGALKIPQVTSLMSSAAAAVGQPFNAISSSLGIGKFGLDPRQLESQGYLKPGTLSRFGLGVPGVNLGNVTQILASPTIWTGKNNIPNLNTLLTNPNIQNLIQQDLMTSGLQALQKKGILGKGETAQQLGAMLQTAVRFGPEAAAQWAIGQASGKVIGKINQLAKNAQQAIDKATGGLLGGRFTGGIFSVVNLQVALAGVVNTVNRAPVDSALKGVIGDPKVPTPDYANPISIDIRAEQQEVRTEAFNQAIAEGKSEREAARIGAAVGNEYGTRRLAELGSNAGLTSPTATPTTGNAPVPAARGLGEFQREFGTQTAQAPGQATYLAGNNISVANPPSNPPVNYNDPQFQSTAQLDAEIAAEARLSAKRDAFLASNPNVRSG